MLQSIGVFLWLEQYIKHYLRQDSAKQGYSLSFLIYSFIIYFANSQKVLTLRIKWLRYDMKMHEILCSVMHPSDIDLRDLHP